MSMLKGCFLIIGGTPEAQLQMVGNLLPDQKLSENNPDVISLKTTESSLGIDDVRSLQKLLSLKPVQSSRKIALIYDADKLTPQAQNALLKTLEEPPGSAQIFLLGRDPDSFLPTILSRCQILNLGLTLPNLNPDERQSLENVITVLTDDHPGKKLKLAAEIASSREEAANFLDQLLIFTHQQITQEKIPFNSAHIAAVFEAKKQLMANCNVRLTMENLFLNW